jgi:hypothetical protein
MVINSGHDIFDKQCSYLTPGLHWGNCQSSRIVRPVSETVTDGTGRVTRPGELFDLDIQKFSEMPVRVQAAIRAMGHTVVVSEIRHHIGSHRLGKKIIHGYVVTDPDNNYSLVRTFQTISGRVSTGILAAVLPFIAGVSAEKPSSVTTMEFPDSGDDYASGSYAKSA